ncbi:MAG: hypothetical protein ACU0GG_20945 [Paracoccaceae bacterium]
MEPHPDFASVDWPRRFELGAHRLTPLAPNHVDEDYAAVMATAPLLEGVFGTWPDGLTRDANLIDLAWHDREFTARRSFSWIVRDADETYIGCFYLFPALGRRGRAKAAFWLCDIPDRAAVALTLKADLTGWLDANLPSEIELVWTTRPELE